MLDPTKETKVDVLLLGEYGVGWITRQVFSDSQNFEPKLHDWVHADSRGSQAARIQVHGQNLPSLFVWHPRHWRLQQRDRQFDPKMRGFYPRLLNDENVDLQ